MNMPFELGVDYGTRQHGPEYMRDKIFLILESADHKYKQALSDLSGVDIKTHKDEPSEIVRSVRDWFYETVGGPGIDYPRVIWNQFNEFTTTLFEERLSEGIPERDVNEDIEKMSISEYIDCAKVWVRANVGSAA